MIVTRDMSMEEIFILIRLAKKMEAVDCLCNGEMFNDEYLSLYKFFPIGQRMDSLDVLDFKQSIVWEMWVNFLREESEEAIADVLISGNFDGINPDTTVEEIYSIVSFKEG